MSPTEPGGVARAVARHAGPLVALAAASLCLPFVRSVWWLADEGIWLHAAQRLARGEMLYRDLFEFYPPLGFLIVTGWTGLFGDTLLAARLLVVATIALSAWLAFACCRIVSGRPALSAVLVLSWVAASQGVWTQVSHQWLSGLFSLVALRAMLAGAGRGRATLAGFAAGAATLVTTHRGALVVLAGGATLLLGRSPRALAGYVVGGLIPLAVILGLLWWQGTLGAAFEQVILFPLGRNAPVMRVSFGAFADLQTLFVVAAFPVIALLLAVAVRRSGRAVLRAPHRMTALLFAFAALLGCFPRPDAAHIAFSVVLALPLLAGLIADLPLGRPLSGLLAATLLLVPGSRLLDAAIKAARAPRIDTAAGRVALLPKDGTRALIERLRSLPPGDRVFFYPYDPMLPYLTGRRHPARIDVLVPQYSPPAHYLASCIEAMEHADWVVIDAAIGTPAFYRAVFPAMTDPTPPERRALETALAQGFAEDTRYGAFRLLRRAAAAPSLCRTR